MKKYLYFVLRIMLIVLCLFLNISHYAKAISDLNFLENHANNNKLPNHFRKSTDEISESSDNNINLRV